MYVYHNFRSCAYCYLPLIVNLRVPSFCIAELEGFLGDFRDILMPDINLDK